MPERLKELADLVDSLGTAPTLEEVARRTLHDKGIAGPTAAHVIEEVHSPLNLAYVTFTTGSTAFQNIVGVTHEEIPDRVAAAHRAFSLAGVARGGTLLVTYAPLVNVFSAQALREYDLEWSFLRRSSRDAMILALCGGKPDLIVTESSFLRVSLTDAASLGFADLLPRGCSVFCAGTPLDLELLPVAEKYGWTVHDLYGCQEFGWLTLDGVPLRDDLSLVSSPRGEQFRELVVGGLPVADSFPYAESGHVCNRDGKIITYRRERTNPEYEVYVRATTFSSYATIERVARTIVRIKGRVVKVPADVTLNAPATVLELVPGMCTETSGGPGIRIEGPDKTLCFDTLAQAQLCMQQNAKTDPTWAKGAR